MFVLLLLAWWYGRGWLWVIERSSGRLKDINEIFSVGILLKTFFSPWKQIQSPKTFQNFIQSTVDNFISRFIGATVRWVMLVAALMLNLLVIFFGLIAFIAWPLIPLLIIIAPIISLRMDGA